MWGKGFFSHWRAQSLHGKVCRVTNVMPQYNLSQVFSGRLWGGEGPMGESQSFEDNVFLTVEQGKRVLGC